MSVSPAVPAPEREQPRLARLAFLYSIPIGMLGGLIGLGGAEFRLPVLAGPLGLPARQSVSLNLAVSLVTLLASLAVRSRTLALDGLQPFQTAITALILGAVGAAFFGPSLAARLSGRRLEQMILALLVLIGCALIVEGFLPQEVDALVPDSPIYHAAAGFCFGVAIGLVSSLLGVAGGELIIPTLLFGFGVGIKHAGTASLFISLPTVAVGLLRYARQGAFTQRRMIREVIAPMGAGSVLGALAGGLLVGRIPAGLLKVALGAILNVSAYRIFHHHRARPG